jgi:hypothetical protein
MATAQSSITSVGAQSDRNTQTPSNRDAAESLLKTIDESTKDSTSVSLLHLLTFGSIGASLALYFAGNKQAGIFVGLWPPTFQALKSVIDKNNERR